MLKTTSSPQVCQTELSVEPIFVVGAPRSGTTLVANILGHHHSVFAPAPGETHYFEDIWTRREEFGELENKEGISLAADRLLTAFGRFDDPSTQALVDAVVGKQAMVERALEFGGGYGGLYAAFTNLLAENAGKLRYCDDTPKHLFHLPAIFDLFPRAAVICCVRDPRGFLSSYKYNWVKKPLESARTKLLYHPVITSLLWRSSANYVLEYADHDRVVVLQYESLVSDPEQEVRRVCSFLELDYSDHLIQVEANYSSFDQTTSGIHTTSVERWRTYLSPEEIWWAQTLTKDNMRIFGYEPEAINPSKWILFSTLLSTPVALLRAIRANTGRRGPLVDYLVRRLSALIK